MLLPGEHFGRGLRSSVGQEAAVVADQHAPLLQPAAGDIVGQRLAQPADVVQREPLADHRAPAAGAELDDVALLLPPRPEEPLLQDEFGPLEILPRVDPLDLVLVVDLIALYSQPVVDQPVRQVGQPVLAVQRRRRQRRQHRPDLPGGDNVRADVQLPDLPHPRRRLRLLDDVHDAAVAVADHAAVGVGPVGDRR